MKRYIVLIILSVILTSLTWADSPPISFTPLQPAEKLTYIQHVDYTKNNVELIIYAEGIKKREIFRATRYRIGVDKENQSTTGKWMTFDYCFIIDKNRNTRFELWFVDGEQGKISRLYKAPNFDICLDPDAKTICICVYNGPNFKDTPTFYVYSVPDMKLLKYVQVKELAGKEVHFGSIKYANRKYLVSLGPRTYDEKNFEIPLD